MTEKALESNFVKWLEGLGGKAVKGPAYQYKGIPDRIGILPNGGGTVWVEFKGDDTYYTLTPLQKHWRSILLNSDKDRYFVVDSKESLQICKEKCITFINNKGE